MGVLGNPFENPDQLYQAYVCFIQRAQDLHQHQTSSAFSVWILQPMLCAAHFDCDAKMDE